MIFFLNLPRNIPRAIWLSVPTVTILYVLVIVSYFTVMTVDEMIASPAVALVRMPFTSGCDVTITLPPPPNYNPHPPPHPRRKK